MPEPSKKDWPLLIAAWLRPTFRPPSAIKIDFAMSSVCTAWALPASATGVDKLATPLPSMSPRVKSTTRPDNTPELGPVLTVMARSLLSSVKPSMPLSPTAPAPAFRPMKLPPPAKSFNTTRPIEAPLSSTPKKLASLIAPGPIRTVTSSAAIKVASIKRRSPLSSVTSRVPVWLKPKLPVRLTRSPICIVASALIATRACPLAPRSSTTSAPAASPVRTVIERSVTLRPEISGLRSSTASLATPACWPRPRLRSRCSLSALTTRLLGNPSCSALRLTEAASACSASQLRWSVSLASAGRNKAMPNCRPVTATPRTLALTFEPPISRPVVCTESRPTVTSICWRDTTKVPLAENRSPKATAIVPDASSTGPWASSVTVVPVLG